MGLKENVYQFVVVTLC